jgi:SAM-dependent methyltransferase
MDAFERNKTEISEAIGKAYAKDYASFMSWFNHSESSERSIIRGAWDFAFYFVTPSVCRYLKEPEKKSCLEIGYGGGRLLHASRSFFSHSYGIDIHPFADKVREKLLQLKPADDFTLFTADGPEFQLEDTSFDYIYSFIVIQHFYHVDILKGYLSDIARIIKPGGLVNLFFADLWKYDKKMSQKYLLALPGGLMHVPAPPDEYTAHNSLWLSCGFMSSLLQDKGFEIIEKMPSYRAIPDGYPDMQGTQKGILARMKS